MKHTGTQNTLYDVRDIHIDKTLPPNERVKKYIRDGYNPYRFIVDGTKVNLSFNGEESLSSCLARALNAMQ